MKAEQKYCPKCGHWFRFFVKCDQCGHWPPERKPRVRITEIKPRKRKGKI